MRDDCAISWPFSLILILSTLEYVDNFSDYFSLVFLVFSLDLHHPFCLTPTRTYLERKVKDVDGNNTLESY